MEYEVMFGVKRYLLAGRAFLTIWQEPDVHVKYAVIQDKVEHNWIVSTVDEAGNMHLQGYLERNLMFHRADGHDDRAAAAFEFLMGRCESLPKKVHVLTEFCSVCGNKLHGEHCGIHVKCL